VRRVPGVLLVVGLAFLSLFSCSYLPSGMSLASGVMESETREAITLRLGSGSTHSTGLMFYPGALVDPHAYVPWLSAVAANGIPVVIAKAGGNLAVFSTDAGLSLKGLLPGVTRWVISGHSLGGAMAAWSVFDHPEAYAGIVFLAAYPSSDRSLASWAHPVLSLSASNDGLATRQKIADSTPLLPSPQASPADLAAYIALGASAMTVFHEISGGNHAQFGSYGAQDGDGSATISEAAQHAEMVAFITQFFAANGW
jgi:pimeloyl-ACP methyl ester carboxylesterase